jgi:hypothetical protein
VINLSVRGRILITEMSKSLELHCSLLLGLNSCGCDAKLAIAYERGRFGGVREFSAIELPALPKQRVSYRV